MMATRIKHNGRLAGWTDKQIEALRRVTRGSLRGKPIMSSSVHPRVLHTLEARKVVMTYNGKIILTANGLAVAKSCGWIKPHES